MRFATVLWFSAGWLAGWLAKLGVMDFAGGIVVHVHAGVAALVCALVLGRRRGFPQVAMPPLRQALDLASHGECGYIG